MVLIFFSAVKLQSRSGGKPPQKRCTRNSSKTRVFEGLKGLRKPESVEGIWNALPNSRGVVKTNLIKALLENRGCRWISNSNSEVKR